MFKSLFGLFEGNLFIGLILSLLTALVLGFLTSFLYRYFKRREVRTKGFNTTLVILPAIISILVAVVNIRSFELTESGLEIGLVLAGIFAISRFRSDPLNAEDLTYIILVFFIGVATGLGYVTYAAIGTLVTLLVLLLISVTHLGHQSTRERRLRFLVPEDLNYEEVFHTILKSHCEFYSLERVKTVDFGSLFELTYTIKLKKAANPKQLIDDIRSKNANLEVTLTNLQQA